MKKTASLVAVVAIAISSSGAPAFAAPRPSPVSSPPGVSAAQPPFPKGQLHSSIGTIDNWQVLTSIAVPAGVMTMTDKPTKFDCPSNHGCTVLISTMAAVLPQVDPSNWAMCTYVDDVQVNNTCYYQGANTTATQFHVGNAKANYSVAKGTHTIHTEIFSIDAATVGGYEYNYEITTP